MQRPSRIMHLMHEQTVLRIIFNLNSLKIGKGERDYTELMKGKLKERIQERLKDKRLLLLQAIKEKQQKIQQKKQQLEQRRQKLTERKQRIKQANQHLQTNKLDLNIKMSEISNWYQSSVEFYCKQHDQLNNKRHIIHDSLSMLRRYQILLAGRIFDIFSEYPSYSIGNSEFKIQKVNLLKNFNEFVLIERNNILKNLGELAQNDDQNNLLATTVDGNLKEEINVNHNYFDQEYLNVQPPPHWENFRSEPFSFGKGFQDIGADLNHKSEVQKRERCNTMEEFENFQGDISTDNPQQKLKNKLNSQLKYKNKNMNEKQFKEEYASFITLVSSEFDNSSYLFEGQNKTKLQERQERIQGAIHLMGLLILGICKYLRIALPYPLKMTLSGFIIKDSAQNVYPLWLRQSGQELKMKHQIQFENGIILLDKNIQYILYLNGYQLTKDSLRNKILILNELFHLPNLGKKFEIIEKLPPPKKKQLQYKSSEYEGNKSEGSSEYETDKFEVLKLQNRQQSANEQLEDMRNNQQNEQQKQIEAQQKIEEIPEWHEFVQDEDMELIQKIRNINLQELIKEDYTI